MGFFMKVAFYLENGAIRNVDFTQPWLGNPGCGGTEYLFSSLPYYINMEAGDKVESILFANSTDHMPPDVQVVQSQDCYEAARMAKKMGCAIFVYRPKRQSEMDMLDLLVSLDLPTVLWIHVVPTSAYIRKIAACPAIRAFVCVEQEQHDTLYDTPLLGKLTYIVNGFDLDGFRKDLDPTVPKDPNMVVHIGTMVPQKNFHLVAQAWPKILSRHPAARLVVIGSGSVYGAGGTLGPWGIADVEYEKRYMIPYLAGPDGHPHPSVKFVGKMGLEKKALIARAIVGIPNPTGDNENCPGTNIEMSACGTAVVSGARYGSLDTVVSGSTGLLGNGQEDLIDNVVFLLKNPDVAQQYGENGISFICRRYNYNSVIKEWENLFQRVLRGEAPIQKQPKRNYFKHQKFARIINRHFQNAIGQIITWPTLNEVKEEFYAFKGRLLK
jgi:glycosyltransferase involved in cell wall biosynthesis